MKKILFLALLIVNCTLHITYAQRYDYDVTVKRGDYKELTFKQKGDVTAKILSFVIKLNTDISSDRLVWKRNTIAGGDTNQVIATYSSPYTTIKVKLYNEDTGDLTAKVYAYDLIYIEPTDSSKEVTMFQGKFNCPYDVQTRFDGVNLADNGTRYTTIVLPNGTLQGEYAWWDTTAKVWKPSGIVPGTGSGSDFDSSFIYQQLALKEPLKGNDDNYVTDAEKIKLSNLSGTNTGDQDLSSYASKSANQTFTGQNIFSQKVTVGSGDNLFSLDNLTLLQDGSYPQFSLKLNEPLLGQGLKELLFDYTGLLTIKGNGIYTGLAQGNSSYNGSAVNSSDINWIIARGHAIYSMNGLRTDGDIYVDSGNVFVNGNINIIGNYYKNGIPITAAGSVGNADSLGSLPASAYVLKTGLDGWSTNLYSGSTNEMRLGKSYNTKRFNNGYYTDVWNIDYVIPPYNLSAGWLFPIEHRTDYYNDTLQTVSGVANLLKIDLATGTPRWKTNDVKISGTENIISLGDVPDSTTLVWNNTGLYGSRITINEENKTATATRFPMPVYGNYFQLNGGSNYKYPYLYSFYSNLVDGNTNEIERGYHFYGKGNFPSYFGGNILTDGVIISGGDTVITSSSGSSIIGTVSTLDSIIIAFWNGTLAGGLTESQVNALIEANEDTTGSSIIGTTATIDSLINAFWAGTLGGGGSSWDSTYAYQRIAALESTVTSLQNSINSILAALDTCGCGAVIVDNTPPLKPTSLVAHGGEYETQMRVTWTDPTASDLDSIRIYRHTSNDSTGAVWIASVAENIETYTNTGRTANTTYWYWAKALDDSSNLSYFSVSDSGTTKSTSGATPLYTLDFEENNLSEWSSTSGANLSASNTFAHTGTYSMRVGSNSFGTRTFTADTEVWLTFWIYLPSTSSQNASYNYISMFNNGIDDRTCFGTNNSTWSEWITGINSGNMTDDDFTTNFSQNAWHKVKMYYQTNGTTTSAHQVWIDDTSIWSSAGAFINSASNFTVGSEAATITNYFYIDDVKLYDTDPGTQD